MNLKSNLSDYTERDFIAFINAILNAGTEDERGTMVEHFNLIVPHPAGSDLLYYPESGADDSPEGVTATIKVWCAAHGVPGFKAG
ncbi:bacteriocin immunity protein [Pseudomonas sp. QE6]|uniref:bacteriocin immunity protein n=1 Tax=Pseudomonas sp. QE6 TaxID=3242491 RepID=UPI003528854E